MDAVTTLMAGLVDYAGLFPPAELAMRDVLENYAEYLGGRDSSALGRLIIPIDRLRELEVAAGGLLPRGADAKPWSLSVLVGGDVTSAGATIREFNCRHEGGAKEGRASVDAVEIKFESLAAITTLRKDIPSSIEIYVELPIDSGLERAVMQLGKSGLRAKLRTGGVTESAFPSAGRIVRFLRACCDAGIPFKATAGLHHPIRAQYRLTYAPDSAAAPMFGYLNLFLAACFMWNGADDATVARVLDDGDSSNFRIKPDGISWLDRTLSANRIAEARRSFATSFGSCSFREPVDELDILLSGAALS